MFFLFARDTLWQAKGLLYQSYSKVVSVKQSKITWGFFSFPLFLWSFPVGTMGQGRFFLAHSEKPTLFSGSSGRISQRDFCHNFLWQMLQRAFPPELRVLCRALPFPGAVPARGMLRQEGFTQGRKNEHENTLCCISAYQSKKGLWTWFIHRKVNAFLQQRVQRFSLD